MKFKQTPFINLEGDFDEAKTLIPRALRELDLLDSLIAFQNLDQGTRVVNFDTGAQISLRQTFGITNINIYSPEVVEEIVVEEISNIFILKLSVKDKITGENILVTEQQLKYLAFYPLGSTDYNKIGSVDKNQPSYLYDPDSVYNRTDEGYVSSPYNPSDQDPIPIFSGESISIPTHFIKDYVLGNMYWISYALGYLPYTDIIQYPGRVLKEDKWQEEDMVIAGISIEDEVTSNLFLDIMLSPEDTPTSKNYYIGFDTNNDKVVEFPFNVEPKYPQIALAEEEFIEDINGDEVELKKVCIFDIDDLTTDEKQYCIKIRQELGQLLVNNTSSNFTYNAEDYFWYPGGPYTEKIWKDIDFNSYHYGGPVYIWEELGSYRSHIVSKYELLSANFIPSPDWHYTSTHVNRSGIATFLYLPTCPRGSVLEARKFNIHHDESRNPEEGYIITDIFSGEYEYNIILPWGIILKPVSFEWTVIHEDSPASWQSSIGTNVVGTKLFTYIAHNWITDKRIFLALYKYVRLTFDHRLGQTSINESEYYTDVLAKDALYNRDEPGEYFDNLATLPEIQQKFSDLYAAYWEDLDDDAALLKIYAVGYGSEKGVV